MADKSVTLKNIHEVVEGDDGRVQFIAQLEELVAQLKAGRTIRTAMVHAILDIDEAFIPKDITEEQKAKMLECQETGVQQIFAATGPEDDIYRGLAEVNVILGQQQAERHKEDCHDPQCDVTDGQAAVLPFLKIVGASVVRMVVDPAFDVAFAAEALKDTLHKAKMLSAIKDNPGDISGLMKMMLGAQEEEVENATMVQLEGDKARGFMQALVGKNILPEEVEESIKKDLAENGPASSEPQLDIPEGKFVMKGNDKTKH